MEDAFGVAIDGKVIVEGVDSVGVGKSVAALVCFGDSGIAKVAEPEPQDTNMIVMPINRNLIAMQLLRDCGVYLCLIIFSLSYCTRSRTYWNCASAFFNAARRSGLGAFLHAV